MPMTTMVLVIKIMWSTSQLVFGCVAGGACQNSGTVNLDCSCEGYSDPIRVKTLISIILALMIFLMYINL